MKRTSKLLATLFIALTWTLQLCLAQGPTQITNHVVIGPLPPVPITPHIHYHFFDPNQSAGLPITHHNYTFTSGNNFFHFHHHQLNNSTTQNNQNSNSNNTATVTSHTGAPISSHHYIDLDLASTSDNTKAGGLLRNGPVDINVGGKELAITSKSLITESEKLAAMQVLFTGRQSLLLDSQGSADGGSLTIGSRLSQHLSNLVIPQGVNITDISKSGILNLSGNLNDSGNLNLITTHSASDTFSILAGNIVVGSQGLISTPGNLNLFARSGDITNNGTISSTNGSIDISVPKAIDINVNSNNGTFQALNGNINISGLHMTEDNTAKLNGGNWLSNQLNINIGSGNLNANVNNVNGQLNISAGSNNFVANTPSLNLGNMNITGDPTWFNTGGNVVISGDIDATGSSPNIAILASGNIYSTAAANIASSAAQTGGNGGNILLVAGASLISSGAASGSNDTTTTVTITGGNSGGGYIALDGSTGLSTMAIASLTSAGTTGNDSGGNITMVAYAGSNSGSGAIALPSAMTVTSGGSGTGNNGSLTIIAGASSGTGINIGNINTTGGTGSGGNISLLTQTPTISGASTMTILNGAITNSTTYTGGTNTAASISTNALTAPGATITAITGGSISINNDVNNNAPTANSNGGTLTLTATGSTSDITVGNIYAEGGGTSGNGGAINISAGCNLTITASSRLDASTANGTGGNVSLTASTNSLSGVFTLGASAVLYVRPNTGDGGTVTVTDNSQGTLTFEAGSAIDAGASNGGNGGNGGTITVTNLGAGGSNGGMTFGDGAYFNTGGTGNANTMTFNAGGSTPGIMNFSPGTNNIEFYGWGGNFNGIGNGGTVTITAAGFTGLSGNSVEIWVPGGFLTGGNVIGISGNGGTINLTTLSGTSTGDIPAADFATGTVSPGNGLELWAYSNSPIGNGGTVNISSGNNLTVPANASIIPAPGLNGNGGNINLTASTASDNGTLTYNSYNYASPSNVGAGTATGTSTVGSGTGNGGSVTLTNNSSGPIIIGTNIDVSGATSGNGGTIAIIAGRGGVSVATGMNLTANGTSGGRIDLLSAGITTINSGDTITANGTTGNGGMIEFGSYPIGGSFVVANNGLIQSTNINNNSGIVGFNGGLTGRILLSGSGSVQAGGYVGFGFLNSATLAVFDPRYFPPSFSLQYGQVYFNQGGGVFGNIFITSAGAISLAPAPNQTRLYEQIGTKIATDYTPWTTYWRQPLLYPYPLQGGISTNRISQTGEALFAASEFNANELTALSQAGIVFGPRSGNNFFDLGKGSVLFMPTRADIQVQTHEGLVSIHRGNIAWIMETGNDCAIYDLHDTVQSGPIKVMVNHKELTLAPGKELLLTRNSNADFSELNLGKSLGYRNVGSSDLGNGIKAYVCDFSIAHGVTNVPVIHNLLLSQDRTHKKAAHQMLKNAAILADLTGYPEYNTQP